MFITIRLCLILKNVKSQDKKLLLTKAKQYVCYNFRNDRVNKLRMV